VNNPSTLRGRALLFDMDGTLIDSSANVERVYRWWASLRSLPIDPILAVERGRPHREVMAQFANGLDLDHESAIFTDFESSDETGMPLVPGAAEAIRVAQQGLWAVVTSAKRRLAEMRFRVTGLPLPKALITSDLIQRGKPDPECYLRAADALNASPQECIVFEDALAGVEAGHRAGMPVVGVNTGGDLAGTEMLIHNFRDIEISYDPDGRFSVRDISSLR
jgi:mannitol-1-/sugar-/sorbitol-6-phosphatase